jgi:hypothetical protein
MQILTFRDIVVEHVKLGLDEELTLNTVSILFPDEVDQARDIFRYLSSIPQPAQEVLSHATV